MIVSTKAPYEENDLIGFLEEIDLNYICDLGLVEKTSDGSVKVRWFSDGLTTSVFASTDTNPYWINFGPDSENLRLFVSLKYLNQDGIQWQSKA